MAAAPKPELMSAPTSAAGDEMIDRYNKAVLTIIAACLAVIAFRAAGPLLVRQSSKA